MNISSAKIWYFVTALIITVIIIRIFIIDSFTVEGDSMAPTIVDGDYIFVNKLAYTFKETPKRDDIVVFNFRELNYIKAVKRVKGLPGEWVIIEGSNIAVKNERDDELTSIGSLYNQSFSDYVEDKTYKYRLDPYEYYLVGDNGLGSVDSRDLGPVDIYKIDGRVIAIFRLSNLSFKLFK